SRALLRALVERRQEDVPALAIGAGAAAESDGERQVERWHLPALLRPAALHRDAERPQEVLCGIVRAMLVLHAFEDRELPARSEMHLELAHAVDKVVVDALGILAALVLARLPAPFEHVSRIARIRDELLRVSPGTGDAD